MSLVTAAVTATDPPYNPRPYSGDVANLQVADATVALWNQEWQHTPVELKYVFDSAVTLTGYVVAPPPDDRFAGPNGWELQAFKHGMPRDPWNRVYRTVDVPGSGRGWDDSAAKTFSFPTPLESVGSVTVTFNGARSLTDIGLSQLYFVG